MTESEWLEWRFEYMTASGAKTLALVNPYQSPCDLWLEKVHRVSSDAGGAAENGNNFESSIMRLGCEELGADLRRVDIPWTRTGSTWEAATLDGLAIVDGELCDMECKLRQSMKGYTANSPREDDWVQVQWQLHVTGLLTAYVIVYDFFGKKGEKIKIWRVERDDEFLSEFVPHCESFWFGNVKARKMPAPDWGPNLSRWLNSQGKTLPPKSSRAAEEDEAGWIAAAVSLSSQITELTNEKETMRNRIKASLIESNTKFIHSKSGTASMSSRLTIKASSRMKE